jgi:diguanylate cyclase (GGDEF)-like protein
MKTLEEMIILLVDDSRFSRDVIKTALEKNGFNNLLLAGCSAEALETLGILGQPREERGVDLILMDVVMKDMDGIETTRRIKNSMRFMDVPIVMVSGVTEKEKLVDAFAAGATDYIEKPINDVELVVRVRAALRLSREIKERKDREVKLMNLARELEDANKKLEALSALDGLTGVPNRRIFDQTLAKEWGRMSRDSAPMSIILIDVDFFKNFNDANGHLAGDEGLKKVAKAISFAVSRPADLMARYGGEEFVIILPETDAAGAERVAQTVMDKVAKLRIVHPKSDVGKYLTVSQGVATTIASGDKKSADLLALSDAALYKAKKEGRNRIVALTL